MIATKNLIERTFPNKIEGVSSNNVNRVIKAVFQLLKETGIKFDKHEHAYYLLSKAGCKISSDGIVKFPLEVIEENLFHVPKCFKWWNRSGSESIEYGSGKTHFIADCKAPSYIDPYTGKKILSDQKGVGLLARLADALPDIDICGTPITTNDFLLDNINTVLNTSKPVLLLSGDDPEILKGTIEIATAVRGGKANLKEKPYFCTLISPEILHYPAFAIEEIKLCTENNIPIFMAEMAIGGVSSPVTIPGTLITCMASTLSGIILTQLFKKGHPCCEASFPTFMDPRTAGIGGLPENSMADMLRLEVCKKLNIPYSQQTALVSKYSKFNQDCVSEIAWNTGMLSTSSFDSFWGAGTLEAGLTYSPHCLVYANELASMSRKVWQGITVDENSIALDVIKEVKNGTYITEDHTAQNTRKGLWRSKYSAPKNNDVEKDLFERINESLLKILDTHEPESLSDRQLSEIENIKEKYNKVKVELTV
jgi:trimethylamine---corrinoid protein Co-methyltransferase